MRYTYKVRLKGTDEWVTLPPSQFNSLSLEDDNRMPEMQGNKVIITNYFNMFWGRIMGARNFRVFMVLSQFAYGNKEYSYPSIQTIAEICNMSENTVKAAIRELEELGFVLQVCVIDNETGENENNVYFIRKTTPFLSVEQYQSLPYRLQKIHQKYLEDIERSERIVLTDIPKYPEPKKEEKKGKTKGSKSARGGSNPDRGGSNFDGGTSNPEKPVDNVENVDDVDKYPEKGGSKFDPYPSINDGYQNLTGGGSIVEGRVGQNLTPNNYNTYNHYNPNQTNSLPNNKKGFETPSEIKAEFQTYLKNRVSKPSFDTWVKTVDIYPEDEQCRSFIVVCENNFQMDWLQRRYHDLFVEALEAIGFRDPKLQFILK
jgi:DNA-binding transcriptional regulator YhcF (GntR family)